MLLPRTLSGLLDRAVKGFPAVLVTGPRQSGKTTLLRSRFGETHRYVSLEAPHVRERAPALSSRTQRTQRTQRTPASLASSPVL